MKEGLLKAGIQTTFPEENIRRWGCYFLSLLKWVQVKTGEGFTTERILFLRNEFVKLGFMRADCFILNPIAILNYFPKMPRFRMEQLPRTANKPIQITFISFLTSGQAGHFVLSHKGKVWDSYGLPSLNDWTLNSHRVFV